MIRNLLIVTLLVSGIGFNLANRIGSFPSGEFEDVVEIKKKDTDRFQLSYKYSVRYLFIGIWVQPKEYILYWPENQAYKSLGEKVSAELVAYYGLTTNTPTANFLSLLRLYSYGMSAEIIIVIFILDNIRARVLLYIAKYKKFVQASDKYIELGGNDKTIIQILSHLKYSQIKDIYVSFECDNQLPADSPTSTTDYNGEKIFTYSPHDKFLPKNVFSFEENTIKIMNSCFSKIIDQDLLQFVKIDNLDNQECKKHVCFKLSYSVSLSFAMNFVDDQVVFQPKLYLSQDNTKQQFYGITVSWNIDIILRGKSIRNLKFSCSPAESFTVYTSSNENFIAKVFDKMVETSFADLEKNLTTELQLIKLLDSLTEINN